MGYLKLSIQQTQKSMQEIQQECEVLLSLDFANMDLDQLKKAELDYRKFANQYQNRPSWTKEQYNAWQYMYFRITQEENKNDSIKIGDVFYASWGYEQTNIDFYKVVEISKTGKTCKVVKIGYESIGDEYTNNRDMCAQIIPDQEKIIIPDPCVVRIEKASEVNPWSKKIEQIGKIQLRGSVFFSNKSKHLETLFRFDGTAKTHSWYG